MAEEPEYLDEDGNPIPAPSHAPTSSAMGMNFARVNGEYLDESGEPIPTAVSTDEPGDFWSGFRQSLPRHLASSAVDAGPMIGGSLGAAAGTMAAGPAGGIAGAAIGGAGGEAYKQLGRLALGEGIPSSWDEQGGEILKQGALQGALEGAFAGTGALAKSAGRGMYRYAAAPINKVLDKYGDIVGAGIKNRIPVSDAGRKKIAGLLTSRKAEKAGAIAAADARGATHSLPVMMRDTRQALIPHGEASRAAGYGDPTRAWRARSERILNENPSWFPLPSEVEGIKSTVDDQLGLAYRKLKNKEPLLPNERFDLDFSQTMGDAQARRVPKYGEMNKGIMDLVGLDKVLRRRVSGSGGNQGLENLLTGAALASGQPLRALAGRTASVPAVMSRLGIGTHMVGEAPTALTANAARAAILALLAKSH
jgi:hypothetical protein